METLNSKILICSNRTKVGSGANHESAGGGSNPSERATKTCFSRGYQIRKAQPLFARPSGSPSSDHSVFGFATGYEIFLSFRILYSMQGLNLGHYLIELFHWDCGCSGD